MAIQNEAASEYRYAFVPAEKSGGATYTPKMLADFVAKQIVEAAGRLPIGRPLRILDPAIGHGELLVSLLGYLADQPDLNIEVYGFETDPEALITAKKRVARDFPRVSIYFEPESFLEFVVENYGAGDQASP